MNQRGQMTIEAILILIILVSVGLSFVKYARDQGWALALVERPWSYVQGMIEDGVWMPAGDDSKKNHPGIFRRHGAWEGKRY